MAYINEFVSREEERVFELPPYSRKVTKRKWTIDKAKDAILFQDGVDRENPEDEYFYFFYKGKIVNIILNGMEYVDSNTKKWKITGISIPNGLKREEVLDELREALRVYGQRGMTISEIKLWEQKLNEENPNGFVVIDF